MEKKIINEIKKDINICLNKKCTECSYWNNGTRCDKRKLLEIALQTINSLDESLDKSIDTMFAMEDRLQAMHKENQDLTDENTVLKDEIKRLNATIKFVKKTKK